MKRVLALVILMVGTATSGMAGLRYAEATAPTSLNPMLGRHAEPSFYGADV